MISFECQYGVCSPFKKTKIQRWLLTCLAQGLGATGGVQTTYQSDDGGEESKAS